MHGKCDNDENFSRCIRQIDRTNNTVNHT